MNINDSCCSYRSLQHAFSLGSSITTLLLLVHIGTKTYYYNKKRECLVAPFDSDKPSFYLMGSRPPSSKKVVEPFISLTASFIWEILRRIKWKSICTKNIIIMIAQQFLGHGGMDTNTLSRNFLLKRPQFQDWKRLWSFCHFWEKWFENSFWQDSITSLNASYVCRLRVKAWKMWRLLIFVLLMITTVQNSEVWNISISWTWQKQQSNLLSGMAVISRSFSNSLYTT